MEYTIRPTFLVPHFFYHPSFLEKVINQFYFFKILFTVKKSPPPLPFFGFKCLHLGKNGQTPFTVMIYPKISYFLLLLSVAKG